MTLSNGFATSKISMLIDNYDRQEKVLSEGITNLIESTENLLELRKPFSAAVTSTTKDSNKNSSKTLELLSSLQNTLASWLEQKMNIDIQRQILVSLKEQNLRNTKPAADHFNLDDQNYSRIYESSSAQIQSRHRKDTQMYIENSSEWKEWKQLLQEYNIQTFQLSSSNEIDGKNQISSSNASSSTQRQENKLNEDYENDQEEEELVLTREIDSLSCPITQIYYKDPHMNPSCGHSYSKEAVYQLAKRSPFILCPVSGCNKMVVLKELVPNLPLQRRVKRELRRKGL